MLRPIKDPRDMDLEEKRGLLAELLRRNASRRGPYPVSFAQQRLWFIQQLAPRSASYNIPSAVRLTGDLDIDVLKRCFGEITRRHEILRTTFVERNGQPVQSIAPATEPALPLIDLRHHQKDERESRARQLVDEEAGQPFDLETGPLFRLKLLLLAANEFVLVVVMHHIISDGWSMTVLVNELTALYEAFSEGGKSPLGDLSLQYGDYALWQRTHFNESVLASEAAYWCTHLTGALEPLNLPVSGERVSRRSDRGASLPFAIEHKVSEALRVLSRQLGVTLFTTLLAGLFMLLYRYTGQRDIVLGTPIAGRNRVELERLMGLFVNTLLLRIKLDGDPSFREIVAQVNRTLLDAQEHQEVPLDRIVEALQPKRDLNRNPLYQVMFGFLANVAPEKHYVKANRIRVEEFGTRSGTAKTDIEISMFDGDQTLVGSMKYRTDLFSQQTIAMMIEGYQTILREVAVSCDIRLSALESVLVEVDRQREIKQEEQSAETRSRQLKSMRRRKLIGPAQDTGTEF